MRGLSLVLNPSRDLFDWSRDLAGDWERLFNNSPVAGAKPMDFAPSVDVEETETHYLVSVDVPGVKKDEIKVEVKENVLSISGERKSDWESDRDEKKRNFHLTERFYGRFERRFTLPKNADTSKVEAVHAEGVLRVSIPKSEEAKPKVISIQVRDEKALN